VPAGSSTSSANLKSTSGSLKDAVEAAFGSYANTKGVPYQDVQYSTVSDDGTYAVVQVTAQFRPDATSDWLDEITQVQAKKVGSTWQVDPDGFSFNLTPAAAARLGATAAATAIVLTATANARATAAELAQPQAERQAATAAVNAQASASAAALAAQCQPASSLPTQVDSLNGESTQVASDTEITVPGTATITVPQNDNTLERVRFKAPVGQSITITFDPPMPAQPSMYYTGDYAFILTYPSGDMITEGHFPTNSQSIGDLRIECNTSYNLYVDTWWDRSSGPSSYTITIEVR
jgi:hypothetical protein